MTEAIVVIDAQNGFITDSSRQVVEKIQSLLEKKLFDHVLFTQFLNGDGSQYERLIGWSKVKTSPETDICEPLRPYAHHIFQKKGYGAFTPAFEKYVKSKGIAKLYFVGIATENCVLFSAVQAFERGYHPIVLADYCASHDNNGLHEAGLKILEKFIGKDNVVRGEFLG